MDPITLAVLGGTQLALGAYQTYKANQGLKELERQGFPKFGITPELANSYARAEEMTRMGFTPQERANFMNDLRRSENLSSRRALDLSGGNLASAIAGVNQSRNVNALNRFAADDASMLRNNIRYADQIGSRITSQRNMDTQAALNYRLQAERALGAAKSQGLQNVTSGLMMPIAGGMLEGAEFSQFGNPSSMTPQGGYNSMLLMDYGTPSRMNNNPSNFDPFYRSRGLNSFGMPSNNSMDV